MKLFYKKDNCEVEVYHFYEDESALVFSPSLAGRQNGNGWIRCKIKMLLPIEYATNQTFMSKTQRNKIKERLSLTSAIWTCTDGAEFTNCDEAINHEQTLMKAEVENHVESEN